MIVAGVMSGTSADGVDVALVRISSRAHGLPRLKVLGHSAFAYPKAVREAVLRAASGEMKVAEVSRLHWRLGTVYAECVAKACTQHGVSTDGERTALDLVGMHGQTIYHQAMAEKFAGASVRATWQIGEPALLAEKFRVPVVSDFRAADLAAGGQGAPLVPMLDYTLFRSNTRNRVLLNLGGIANMTAIPAGASLAEVIAFDSGPANMVIDALMHSGFGKTFDRGGKVAAGGRIVETAVADALRLPYFSLAAPKSCGREQFGAEFVSRFRTACGTAKAADIVASATALTVRSIYEAYARIVWPHLGVHAPLARGTDLVVAGGGARNAHLMRGLRDVFQPLGVKVMLADDLGLAAQAKEAVAFALLAWLSRHGMPGNIPSATGAARSVVLGKVTC